MQEVDRNKSCSCRSSCQSTKEPVSQEAESPVMDKNVVTRTFSIGAICSGTKGSDNVYTARRHSSAGIRALLWATSSPKSFECSLGSDFQTSRESIFQNILTPDSIPQFTIPSLSVQNSLRSLDKEARDGYSASEEGLENSASEPDSSSHVSQSCSMSSSSSGLSLKLSDRRAERSVSDPFSQRRSLLHSGVSNPHCLTEAQHCMDPASRAALSLPHLTKVTTPYGFITLGQSPQMASEEALLCQAGLRRLNVDEDTVGCLHKAPGVRTVDVKGDSSHLSGDKKKLSKDSADSQNPESAKEETKSSSSTTTNRNPKRKQRFYKIIRKHFTSLGMKSCD